MPFVHSRRIRSLGRRIPGLPALHHAVTERWLLWRGVAPLDYPRATIKIHATSEEIVHLRLRPVAKEPWTVAWLERVLRPADVLYDIGANVGTYALIAASIGRGDVRVVAVEPAYANYASLCDNIVLNAAADAVTPLPVVLGERTRLGSLTYRDVSAGAAIHRMDVEDAGAYRQPVLVFALDDLIERFELPPPTLVKLDVDGAEASVLAGAAATLARPELRSLVIEIESEQTDAVLAETRRAGFTLAEEVHDRYGEMLPGVWYGVFHRA